MFLTKKNLFSRLYVIIILFIVLNLFLYSIISIGLYKLICYDQTTEWYTLIFSEKYTSVFYISDVYFSEFISDAYSYQCSISTCSLVACDDVCLEYNFLWSPWWSIQNTSFLYTQSVLESSKEINLIFMNFFIRSTHLNWIQSLSLQKTIIINFNESSLFFFRIYNPTHVSVKLLTLYLIYPNFLTLYINKIQCFCFNAIFLYPLEIVDIPVLIYVYPFANNFLVLNNIIIYYVVFLN